ncbi:MAG TPA: helix-turn-helix transcriptional regulator [Solirubrobacteraceae bacterium]|nr:helix-turn-helix transcriptional regulator [Solirubrobacteraceae bacterium]
MADTNLKNALRRAGLTPEEFADIVRVDPKTVQRWVAGTTTPYPRHRATIARALDLTEHDLWPESTPPPAPRPEPGDRHLVGSEVTGTWGRDSDPTAPDPVAFLSDTDGPIDLLENFRGIQLTPELARALAEHAAVGRQVRVLTNRPIRQVEPLLGLQGIEIRYIEYLESSFLRVGDAMLLALIVDYEADQPPPFLQLHRTTNGGLFDRLLDNLDTIAAGAEGPITTPEQLDRYRTNQDDESDEDGTEPSEDSSGLAGEPSVRAGAADDPALPDRGESLQRRWPRRPN